MTVFLTKGSRPGRYRSVNIGKGEAETARAILRFMLRLRMCEEAWPRISSRGRDAMPGALLHRQEAVPAALSVLLRKDDYLFCITGLMILSFEGSPMTPSLQNCMASTPGKRGSPDRRTYRFLHENSSAAPSSRGRPHFSGCGPRLPAAQEHASDGGGLRRIGNRRGISGSP